MPTETNHQLRALVRGQEYTLKLISQAADLEWDNMYSLWPHIDMDFIGFYFEDAETHYIVRYHVFNSIDAWWSQEPAIPPWTAVAEPPTMEE